MKTYFPSLIFLFIGICGTTAVCLMNMPKGLGTFIATLNGAFLSMALFGSVGKYLHKRHQAHLNEVEEATLRDYYKDQ